MTPREMTDEQLSDELTAALGRFMLTMDGDGWVEVVEPTRSLVDEYKCRHMRGNVRERKR